MLTEREIIDLSKKRKSPLIIGVYFLIYMKKIVYVGQCNDVYRRINTHKNNKNVRFSNWSYISCCNIEIAKKLEVEYIKMYRPKYNIKDNPSVELEKKIAIYLSGDNKKTISYSKAKKILIKNGVQPKFQEIGKYKKK